MWWVCRDLKQRLSIDTSWANYDIGDPDFNPINLTPVNGIVSIAPARVDTGTIPPMEAMSGDSLEVPIHIDWGLNQVIGSYDFTIAFDPEVFEATGVTGGTTPREFSGTPTFQHRQHLGNRDL